ncbi:MAG: peptide-methionine (R)-S-oxide reductase MsrB [Magnetococcus sp. WYHC-3]
MSVKFRLTDAEWRARLSGVAFHVCRQRGTEPPFSGACHPGATPGVFHCVCCGAELFDTTSQFDSGSGWPSFFQPISSTALEQTLDSTHGMVRTEVHCARCDAHLGHVFPDGPAPTGLRYCVNSVALVLHPRP